MLEQICMLAIQHAANFANLLGINNDYSPLLEGIATNFFPHSGFQNVNLSLLRLNRIRLLHNKSPSSDTTKDIAETLGMSEARAREVVQDRPDIKSAVAPFNYDTLKEVRRADSLEEIARVEQKLHNLLEDQLDGADAARIKALIYEGLASLAIRRLDCLTAIHHTDAAIRLTKPCWISANQRPAYHTYMYVFKGLLSTPLGGNCM